MTSPASLPDATSNETGALPTKRESTPRRRPVFVDVMLVIALIGLSALAGWNFGREAGDDFVVVEASYSDLDDLGAGADEVQSPVGVGPSSEDIGRMKAELLRLRVLFQRLAEVADIDHDGEFDVDFEIDELSGDGEPLSRLDPTAPDALEVLFSRLDPMIAQVDSMQHIFRERRREYDLRLSGRPIQGGEISSGYGTRTDPLSGTEVVHRGLDFVAEVGEPILAIADGVVTFSGPNGGYGLLVELEHADGFKTRYAHNDANLVQLGSRVRKGEAVATLGSSGRSTGPHVHLEVRHRGKPLDPRYFVR